jgi:hypothetical protein
MVLYIVGFRFEVRCIKHNFHGLGFTVFFFRGGVGD